VKEILNKKIKKTKKEIKTKESVLNMSKKKPRFGWKNIKKKNILFEIKIKLFYFNYYKFGNNS
jgi:hypothetical protein